MSACHFWTQNGPLALKTFFRKTIDIIFMYLLILLIKQNFKKIVGADPELQQCVIFGPKMDQLP